MDQASLKVRKATDHCQDARIHSKKEAGDNVLQAPAPLKNEAIRVRQEQSHTISVLVSLPPNLVLQNAPLSGAQTETKNAKVAGLPRVDVGLPE